MKINFNVSEDERVLIGKIIDRVIEKIASEGFNVSSIKMDMVMDLSAAHNACPLDLGKMLAADYRNLIHDVAGIRNHLNRKTGVLEGCFLPRFAKKQHEMENKNG